MFEDEVLDFEADSEIRKQPPAGTIAMVQVRPDRDGNLGDFKNGRSEYGPWMLLPFEVTEGEYKGQWASMMISVKTTDPRFRSTFEVATGIDIKDGAQVSFSDFKDKLISGVFEAEIGPERRKGQETGSGYTQCFKLIRRVGDRDAAGAAASDNEVPVIGESDEHDEDVPF